MSYITQNQHEKHKFNHASEKNFCKENKSKTTN